MPTFPPEVGSIWIVRAYQPVRIPQLEILGPPHELVVTATEVSIGATEGMTGTVVLVNYSVVPAVPIVLSANEWEHLNAEHLSRLRGSLSWAQADTRTLTVSEDAHVGNISLGAGASITFSGGDVSMGTGTVTISAPDAAIAQKAVLDAVSKSLKTHSWSSKNDLNARVIVSGVVCGPRTELDLLQISDLEVQFAFPNAPPNTSSLGSRMLTEFLAEFEVRPPIPEQSTAPTIWERLSHDD